MASFVLMYQALKNWKVLSISEKRSAEEEAAKCKRIKAEADANMRAAKAEIEAARSGQQFFNQSDIMIDFPEV